ncbi:RICIN domain-containing protein [Kitasatospora sp. NPDC097643]|uniref:RICIN domain-containing protein n=1 Tax=Kitasatospora sp. NPDC097643 TaxID=3157230 RepID=UPI003316EA0E
MTVAVIIALLATLVHVLPLFPPSASAAVADHTVATWNMQRATRNWEVALRQLLLPGREAVALQEVPDSITAPTGYDLYSPDPLPDPTPTTSPTPTPSTTPTTPPPPQYDLDDCGHFVRSGGRQDNDYYVCKHEWKAKKRPRTGPDKIFIYYLNTSTRGTNLAFITPLDLSVRDGRGQVDVLGWRDTYDGGGRLPKPMLGIKVGDTWFYNAHMLTGGGADAVEQLKAVSAARAGEKWAVMGDFNRRPSELTATATAVGARVVKSGQNTRPASPPDGRQLDYMVASDPPAGVAADYNAFVQGYFTDAYSDHRPVVFRREPVQRRKPQRDSCPPAGAPALPAQPAVARAALIASATGPESDATDPTPAPAPESPSAPAPSSTDPTSTPTPDPTSAPAPSGTDPVPQHGRIAVLTAGSGNLVADLGDGKSAPAGAVRAAAPNCSPQQSWATWQKSDDTWVIETGLTNGVTPEGKGSVLSTPAYGDQVTVRPIENDATGKPDGSPGQRWRFVPDEAGWYRVLAAADSRCLTAPTDGTGLTVATCDGSARQRWRLAAPCTGPGRAVPGFPGIPWPTVSGRPELTWPSLPGHPAIPWPAVPGSPGIPMPGHPDLPEIRWPGFPDLPKTPWPAIAGHPDASWPSIPGFPTVPWPAMPGHPDIPWPVLPLPGNGNDAGTDLVPGLPAPADPAIPGHPELSWPTVPGFPQVKWPALPGFPNIPWPGHPAMPTINPPTTPTTPTVPRTPWPGLPDRPSWGWPSIPGFPNVPWPSLPGLPDVPWPTTSGFPNDPATAGAPPEEPQKPMDCEPPGTDQPAVDDDTTPDNGTDPSHPGGSGGDPGGPGGPSFPSLPGIFLPFFPVLPSLPSWGSGPSGPSGPAGPWDGPRPDPTQGIGITSAADAQLVPDVRGGVPAVGTPVQAWQPNGTDSQRWAFWDRGNGNWLIETRLTYGGSRPEERLVIGHDTGTHQTALQAAATDRTNQFWRFTDAGNGWSTVVNGDGGGCLTSAPAGQPLTVNACDGSDRQKWRLTGPTGSGGGDTGNGAVPVYSAFPGKCLDVTGGNTANRTPIDLYDCNATASQRWTPSASSGVFTLKAFGKCLDVAGGATDRGTRVGLYDCNATTAQNWQQGNDSSLVNPASGKCLDVTGGNAVNGTALQIWDCNATDSQRWGLGSVPPRAAQPPAPQPGTGPAVDPGVGAGQVSTLVSANNGMVADLDGAGTGSGTSIKALGPNGNDAQRWAFWDAGNGRWILETLLTDGRTAAGQGMVMDHDPGNHRTHLVRVMDGNANQHWAFRSAGGGWYWITSDTDGGCLTANNPGEALAISPCDGSDRQKWRLGDVANGPNPPGQSNPGQPTPNPATGQVVNPGVRNNQVATLRSANNGMVADLDGAGTGSGTSIKALGANGNDAQRWAFWDAGNGRWILETLLTDGRTAAGQGMVMDHDPGNHRTHLIKVMDGNANQHWAFHDASGGWYWITSDTDGGCLTANNPGEALAISPCDGSDRQKWRLDNPSQGPNPPNPATGQIVNPGVADNRVATLRSANNGLVADLDGGGTNSGTSIKALGPNGNDAQRWAFWSTANGRWIIETLLTDGKAAPGQGMVMDHDPGNHRTHLIKVMDGNANQHWAFHDASGGWYWITSDTDGGCLTANNPGEALAISPCDGSDRQKWRLDNPAQGPAAPQPQPQPQPGGSSGGSPGGPVLRPNIGDSQVATLRSNNNGMVADLDSGNTSSGTAIKALGANGNAAQRWAFWDAGNGRWIIETLLTDGKAAPGQGMVMDHNPGIHRTHLTQNQAGNNNQRWTFRDAGGGWYWIVSETDGGCLTANNPGEQLGVWRCDGSDKQRWRLDNVQTGPTPGAGGGFRGPDSLPLPPQGGGQQSAGCALQPLSAERQGRWMWKDFSICRGQTFEDTGNADQWTVLKMEDNGELALYYTEVDDLGRQHTVKEWSAPNSAGCGIRATMQTDGNFVVYGNGRVCWASGTNGHDNAWLEINQGGALTVWWVDEEAVKNAERLASRMTKNLAQLGLGELLTLAAMIPRWQWAAGSQHRISVPNCGKLKCF